jgi:hypothetical protein
MPGLDPGIPQENRRLSKEMDGRTICAKTRFAVLLGHDDW